MYHLEAKRTVDHKQDQIGDFANVYHRVEIIIGFNEGKPSLFATDNSDRAFDLVQSLLGISSHETFE